MDHEKTVALLTDALGSFHGRFKKMYGQAFARLDSSTYLSTGDVHQLSAIDPDSYEICDINSGDIGEIFRRCPGVNAIIVGCSPDTVFVSGRGSDLPVTLEDLAHLTGPFLKIIPDAGAASVISALSRSSVCLINGVGALSAASNPRKAAAGIHIVEKACEAEVHGAVLGGTIPIPEASAAASMASFRSDYVNLNESASVPYIGYDEEEFALRSQLIEAGKELVRRDLAYGSWGNLSVKLNDEEMLITPSSMDYFDIRPEDIVKVNINTLEYGLQRVPSGTSAVHAGIYRELPDRGSVIHTHSNALSVFAACRAGFAITDPAMHQIIGDILISEYAPERSPELAANITDTLRSTHAAIIPNHGGIFTGPTPDVVLAIAEAVEIRARNLLNFDGSSEDTLQL